MAEISKAAFSFSDYRIKSFSYKEGNNPTAPLKIEINPVGVYYQSEAKYVLDLFFIGTEDVDKGEVVAEVNGSAVFSFASNLSFAEIPEYFYQNAVAIFFPYLRAFLSTMTLQANRGIIVLGTMNLQHLTPILKQQTTNIPQSE